MRNNEMFVQYDINNERIIAGPQGGMSGQKGWYPYVLIPSDNPRQKFGSSFNKELGAVFQVPLEEENSFTYKEMRSQAYPKIADQLDMLFHDIANNKLTERGDFYAALKAVKDTYPKS
jgi:hypothetical protein